MRHHSLKIFVYGIDVFFLFSGKLFNEYYIQNTQFDTFVSAGTD